VRGRCRAAIAGILAISLLFATLPSAWAGERYEVKGTATVAAMPDIAEFEVPLSALTNGWSEPPRVKSGELVEKFRRAVPFDVSLHECPNQRYSCVSVIEVRVSDFSVLPTLARIATESEYKGWAVFYDLGDVDGLAKRAKEAALADATEKAALEARRLGLKKALLAKVDTVRVCELLLHDELGNCYIEGGPSTEEIVVKAFGRNFLRTDFSVPVPQPKKQTATVDAVFELE